MGQLQKRLPPHIGKIYYPIDCRKFVARALAAIHPDAIILVEGEIWPNFLWRARSLDTPLFLINARLSDRSHARYRRFGFLFRDLFASFTAVGAQNESDAARLREIGCRQEAVQVVGNLKFDAAASTHRRPLEVRALLAGLRIPTEAPLFVAGSTHAGEEDILAEQFLRLRAQFPELILVLVPRHFERAREIARTLAKRGIRFVQRSEISRGAARLRGDCQCLLVNTTGELRSFYEHATIVFVGKSLTAKGGQNPIEPAALGKAVIFGPNMQNFAEVTRVLLAADAAVQVRDATALEQATFDLLSRPERREELGRNAREVVRKNQGAAERTVDLIVRQLGGQVYIAPKT
jgi:3-deoxy-D-manno-octulosonic-acid transferase